MTEPDVRLRHAARVVHNRSVVEAGRVRDAARLERVQLGLLGLLIVALIVSALAGCGGPPKAARIALEQTAGGLVVADELLAHEVQTRGAAARAQVRAEVRAGTIAGETTDETVERGLARWDDLMRPLATARTALRTASAALHAIEAALDAWAAGSGDGPVFLGAVACGVVALRSAVDALSSAGVRVPGLLGAGVDALGSFGAGACPGGE